jgi:Icc-related predicted phosphoesterase
MSAGGGAPARGACFFVSDLHGDPARYARLFAAIRDEAPPAVFLGGDLLPAGNALPGGAGHAPEEFIDEVLARGFAGTRDALGPRAPRIFLILGNDDSRAHEARLVAAGRGGLWEYAHGRRLDWGRFAVYGYACVPPTPFQLKDWERYDVSRYVDPGCVSPEEGWRSFPVDESDIRWGTIQGDLERLAGADDLTDAVFLMHAPPYGTPLDRAALDTTRVEHAPLDLHVGSIAIQRFIAARQPRLTLHGHIHESARLTGAWRTQIGHSHCLSAAHDGPELALVRFDPEDPAAAARELLATD